MATLAAVDLGAQSGRVAVGRFDGEQLGVTEVHRFSNAPVRTHGTLHWDILRLYADVLDGLRAAAREAGRVDSVAVDSWGVDFGLVDRQGRLVSCEQGRRRVTRTEHDGSITVLASEFQGKRLNSPNDVVEHSDGSI